jgi:hypothetical protein
LIKVGYAKAGSSPRREPTPVEARPALRQWTDLSQGRMRKAEQSAVPHG